jgi:hypothetical protein
MAPPFQILLFPNNHFQFIYSQQCVKDGWRFVFVVGIFAMGIAVNQLGKNEMKDQG